MPMHNRKMSFLSKLFLFRKVENPMKKKIAKLCKRPAKECPDNIIFVGTQQLFSFSSYWGFDFKFDIVIRDNTNPDLKFRIGFRKHKKQHRRTSSYGCRLYNDISRSVWIASNNYFMPRLCGT